MFFDLDAGVERGGSVIGQDGNGGLGNDGSGVHAGIDKVDGTTALARSVFDGLGPGKETGVVWKERGVDVDDPARESIQERSAEEAHESRQADEIDPRGDKIGGGLLLGRVGKFGLTAGAVDVADGDSRLGGALENVGIRHIGEHEGDFGVQMTSLDGFEDGLHIGAGTGAENTEANHGGTLARRIGSEKLQPEARERISGQSPDG